jgi:hypothetical protein
MPDHAQGVKALYAVILGFSLWWKSTLREYPAFNENGREKNPFSLGLDATIT